ncbi:MAG: hypothetical protein KGN34_07190 [Sphingomonadales bacterium]|nr:hypothetical protein [Sphingomonadales bacterium]
MNASEPWPVPGKDRLDDDQRALWDELTLGPRGFYTGGAEAARLPDLYNAWLQFPALGQEMLRLGDAIRHASHLPGWARELVVLVTSAWGQAWVEFDFHVPFARNEGLDEALIAALRAGEVPVFGDDGQRVVWTANRELLLTATLAPETRAAAIALLGWPGVMQLIANVMLYTVTAWTTNVARVKLADDFAVDQGRLDAFFAGRDGNA